MRDLSEVIELKMKVDRAREIRKNRRAITNNQDFTLEEILQFIDEWEEVTDSLRRFYK